MKLPSSNFLRINRTFRPIHNGCFSFGQGNLLGLRSAAYRLHETYQSRRNFVAQFLTLAAPSPPHFNRFSTAIEGIALPDIFQYPFHYEPHEIALVAAKELQDYLQAQTEWVHDFGFDQEADGHIIGKMFGVLVVRSAAGEIGYLCAVSGKLAEQNLHTKFVPPVFDILVEDGFFKQGEAIITAINERIQTLEQDPAYRLALDERLNTQKKFEDELHVLREHHQRNRAQRHESRKILPSQYVGEELTTRLQQLNQQSINDNYIYKDTVRRQRQEMDALNQRVQQFEATIDALKAERKSRSAALQDEIFSQFYFVNQAREQRSLGDIFRPTAEGRPIAGSGECAAPKLLQYAFLHELHPIAMAEFWWGESPKTVLRLHGHYYPACRGKCEPILNYMLNCTPVAPNPLLENPAEGKDLEIIWEDEHIVVVNKPAEFLSVPGKNIEDSVYQRLRQKYPSATGPLVVHRLDMSTSGLLIAAKNEAAHKHLQNQFIERTIKKRYIALLEGLVPQQEGRVDLPLRVDLDDRPRQMVCYTYGKPAQTNYKVLERSNGRTRIHFFPVTGRTHQLRVHAAHALGLHCPIVGDDLYGERSSRLHLHAEWLQIVHPVTGQKMTFKALSDF